eukprot:361619-Chlamydomonas_euryale.AAC.1
MDRCSDASAHAAAACAASDGRSAVAAKKPPPPSPSAGVGSKTCGEGAGRAPAPHTEASASGRSDVSTTWSLSGWMALRWEAVERRSFQALRQWGAKQSKVSTLDKAGVSTPWQAHTKAYAQARACATLSDVTKLTPSTCSTSSMCERFPPQCSRHSPGVPHFVVAASAATRAAASCTRGRP